MLFNSAVFLYAFLPISFLVYWLLNSRHLVGAATVWLFCSSMFFYAWWNPSYLPLILISIAVNFSLSRLILHLKDEQNREKAALTALWGGILFNICLLGYYKYANFFASTYYALAGHPFRGEDILLPLAVSFFSIQQVVFLVDTYQGLCGKVSPIRYAVYISFFPHLIAGPIVLHNELIPQVQSLRNKIFSAPAALQGLMLLSIGLLKKLVLADTLAVWAKAGFDSTGPLGFVEAWSSSLSYTMQLYFDFSGYSDMAVGVALLFNMQLPTNFRSPYRAKNIITFWQNWHITLSRFITNYLYTPILRSFNKIDFARSMVATLLAMLIAGFWHGADWRFVVFGAMHGFGLVLNHIWKRKKWKMPAPAAWAITFLWVNLAFVFFRAESWEAVGRMVGAMASPAWESNVNLAPYLFLGLAFAIVFFAPRSEQISEWMKAPRRAWVLASGVVLALALTAMEFQNANEFLYFKF